MSDGRRDLFLSGRLVLVQPEDGGHRAGHDGLLLAATVPDGAEGLLVDLGAGSGLAGLAVALRCPALRVVLLDNDPQACRRAALSIAATGGLDDRARVVTLCVTAPAAAMAENGLGPGTAQHVIFNPPFHPAGRSRPSPDPGRAAAHHGDGATLPAFLKAARRLLTGGGRLSLIHRADALDAILPALATGFGAIAVRPVAPRPDRAAIRVLVTATAGSRAPLTILPTLHLETAAGQPDAQARRLIDGGALAP